MVAFIVITLLFVAVVSAFGYLAQNGLKEREMEQRIRRIGLRAQGEIVGRIGASQKKVNMVTPLDALEERYPEKEFKTNGLAIIEFDTEDGRRFRKRSKKPPRDLSATTLEVIYDPENPSDCMIDGFYRIHPFYPITFMGIGGIGILTVLIAWFWMAMFSEVAIF
ncbi:MAG: DUF3592 domain-containing protein [Bacteroidota bacterium]